MSDLPISAKRRHDLDWLRVLAFGLLIFYHIGMLYVEPWGYHYKSAYTSSALANLMLLVNPWRMPILWLISGVATSYLLGKMDVWRFLASRSARLLLPLAFGVWVIVPPQLWVEMSARGHFVGGYWTFYRQFLDPGSTYVFDGYQSGIWPHVDVNHLWYLRELWQFTLLLIIGLPLFGWIRRRVIQRVLMPAGAWTALVVAPLLLAALDVAAMPGFGEEGRRIAIGLCYFLLGYLIADRDALWVAFAKVRGWALSFALFTFGVFLTGYHGVWLPSEAELPWWLDALTRCVDQTNRWLWLVAVLGYALHYLNKPHPVLKALAPAVYPAYLVHQTLILLIAYGLASYSLGGFVEPIVVSIGTFAGCALFYIGCRQIAPLRPLVGLKWGVPEPARERWMTPLKVALATAIVLPTAWAILI